jgi:hypothetical protein
VIQDEGLLCHMSYVMKVYVVLSTRAMPGGSLLDFKL